MKAGNCVPGGSNVTERWVRIRCGSGLLRSEVARGLIAATVAASANRKRRDNFIKAPAGNAMNLLECNAPDRLFASFGNSLRGCGVYISTVVLNEMSGGP